MKAILYNRILLFLAFAGLFVAGTLSLAKLMNVVLPCGASASCETVTNDPSSMLFGVLPLAYIGFGAYLAFLALAVIRSLPKVKNYSRLVFIGFVMSAFGTVTSIGLQMYSILVIQALCKWCLASALIMTLSVIFYALLYQDIGDLDPELLQQERAKVAGQDHLLLGGFSAIAILGLVGQGFNLRFADHTKGRPLVNLPKNFPLIPVNGNIFGDPKSPIKVIEFADLNCPACQKSSPMLKDFVRQHPGQIVVYYRHFPLPMHATSALAASIDEYAAEKGKFWEYTMAVMGTKREIKEPNELFLIAGQEGLDVNDLRRHLNNEKDPIYVRLNEDMNAANVVGVLTTPTFIVETPKTEPKAFSATGMMDAFGEKPYADYLVTKG